MKLGKYNISRIFKVEKYKTIYVAQYGPKTYFVHEHSNPAMASHEYEITHRLAGCHVDQFIDSFKDKEKILLVQEPFTGIPVESYFTEGALLQEKINIARSVLSILKSIHDAGVIYNNLALENITIDQSRQVMLHNFLPATPAENGAGPGLDTVTDPRFTAPERTQRIDEKPSFASDYYSLGILMYRLLTGKLPFNAEDLPALILLHVARQPTRPCLVNTQIPDTLSRTVEKLLEKSPSNRYKSIEGILYDLDHFSDFQFLPGTMDMDPKFKVSAQIYGRQKEIDRLKKAAESLKAGKVGLVCISGYSGVGKSTIVLEFQKSLTAHEYRFICGKFQQYKKDTPYFALIEAFNSLFDLLLLSNQAQLDEFTKSFKTTIGDQGQILTSVFPKLELIVGKQQPVEPLMGENAQNRFNYIFIKFINIIATRERPLILCLDDIQWTDQVSLNVLRALLLNRTGFVLVILCYRSNEVGRHHPFQQWINEVDTLQIPHGKIAVTDLHPEEICSLVADSLGRQNPTLSNIAFQKTNGNAFFVHQLLNKMADDNCFIPDIEHKTWQVDLKKVSSLEIAGNVVALMQARLERLPVKVLDLVKVIGAVGHNVDLDVLSMITKKGRKDIARTLKQPFEYGLLNQKKNHLNFTHDKIQQACYQLNSPEELPFLHFTIAKTLMRNKPDQHPDDLFNLVGHLDKGFGHICEHFESYVEIYMKAAVKSKEISAYNEFLHYAEQALSLLQKHHPETLRHHVYRQYHIALYLNSRFKAADDFFSETLSCIQNHLSLKENYFAKISQDSMLKKYKQAVQMGLSVLKPFGVELDIKPGLDGLNRHLDAMEFKLAQAGLSNISDLLQIEQKHKDEMTFICEIITAMVPASFFYDPKISCLLFFTVIELAIKNGVFESMAYALSAASIPFILIRNDYRSAYRYAEFAVQVAAANKRALGNAEHIMVLLAWHWCKSMKDDTALEIAGDAHHLLVQGGDIQMAGYTYFDTVSIMWERGDTLQKVLAEAQKAIAFNEKTQNLHGTAIILPFYQMVKTLMSVNGTFCNFSRDGFSETAFIETNKENPMALGFLFVYKTQLAYMAGAFEQAYAFGCRAQTYLFHITGFISVQTGLFYAALSACAVLDPADEKWDTVTRALDQMRRWSRGSADNFKHKYRFLEAEIARKKNDVPLAIRCYIQAVVAVRQNRFLHEKALIYERFASFWAEQENNELCEYYIQEAIQDYEYWGAIRISRQLRQKYHHIHFDTPSHDLDLLSVINAQNILAQETDIRALLKQMMQILLEVSGAERGILILKTKDWHIEAFKNIEGEEILLKSLPLHRDMLCVDMVNYVIRTGQPASLEQFSVQPENAYMTRVKPQSLMAVPAIVGSKTIAVIYLEHRKIKNTFTASRRETVKLLSTQIAISLNNAQIYNQLELRVKERTKMLAAQNQALKIARKKADQANEAKSQFLNNMSHELRTPLIAVTGFSELLSNLVSDPKQKSYVDAVKTAGNSLVTLVNDVLDLSKIEAGKMDITYAPVNLRTIFMEIEQIFCMACKAKKLKLVVCHCKDLPSLLYLDEIRIRQIMLNLVGNAVKFTDTGRVTISSHVKKTSKDKLELTLSVQDTGIGIAEAEQELIFQSFEQQKNQDTAKYGGTGLGLTITRRLVNLMKGTITVTSTPARGSRFEVKLFNVAQTKTHDTEPEKSYDSLENIVFNRERILVVEPIEANRLFLQTALSKMNLEVMTANNGYEAILLAIERTPELIVTDIKMPVVDGFRVAGTLKTRPDTGSIPIIALSASPTREEKEAVLTSGFAAYLAKPPAPASLLAVITQYVPYKTIDHVTDETTKNTKLILLSRTDKPDLLCRQLQDDILPCFENLKHAFVANEFKTLAEQLSTAGKTFNIKEISDMGNHMLDLLTAFDIKKMKECLTEYAKTITTSIHNLEVPNE